MTSKYSTSQNAAFMCLSPFHTDLIFPYPYLTHVFLSLPWIISPRSSYDSPLLSFSHTWPNPFWTYWYPLLPSIYFLNSIPTSTFWLACLIFLFYCSYYILTLFHDYNKILWMLNTWNILTSSSAKSSKYEVQMPRRCLVSCLFYICDYLAEADQQSSRLLFIRQVLVHAWRKLLSL